MWQFGKMMDHQNFGTGEARSLCGTEMLVTDILDGTNNNVIAILRRTRNC